MSKTRKPVVPAEVPKPDRAPEVRPTVEPEEPVVPETPEPSREEPNEPLPPEVPEPSPDERPRSSRP